jgi:DNA-binding NtrC family response regulator
MLNVTAPQPRSRIVIKEDKIRAKVLLLEDDIDLQELFRDYFTPRGYNVICRSSAEDAEREIISHSSSDEPIDLVVTDFRLPNMNGLELIVLLKKIAPTTPIILVTAHSSLDLALEAIEKGAFDFVVKPIQFSQLALSMERAIYVSRLLKENQNLKLAMDQSTKKAGGFVAKSASMLAIIDLAKRVAGSSATVLLNGESGTGKEVLAQLIHSSSPRAHRPFVAINCSAIPEALLESELFGHAKGSFTGADDKKVGLFEEAEGGTLFLDEIGDLSLPLQAKLLRVLQERKIRRVGENQYRDIDVRILAATHKNLAEEVRAKRFRDDLFFRLNVIPIKIPSLRERREDVLPLAAHFLKVFTDRMNSKVSGFSKKALHYLIKNNWPGNVRELENAIERAVVLCESEWIEESHFFIPTEEVVASRIDNLTEENISHLIEQQAQDSNASAMGENTIPSSSSESNRLDSPLSSNHTASDAPAHASNGAPHLLARGEWVTLDDLEKRYIKLVLNEVDGVKEKAAKILDVDRKTLYRKLVMMDVPTAEAEVKQS